MYNNIIAVAYSYIPNLNILFFSAFINYNINLKYDNTNHTLSTLFDKIHNFKCKFQNIKTV